MSMVTNKSNVEIASLMSEVSGHEIYADCVFSVSKSVNGNKEYEVFVARQPDLTDENNMLVVCFVRKDLGCRVLVIPNLWVADNELFETLSLNCKSRVFLN